MTYHPICPFTNYQFKEEYRNALISDNHLNQDNNRKIIEWMKDPKNILLIMGPPGTGKTTLLAGIINHLIDKKKFSGDSKDGLVRGYRLYDENHFMAEMKKCISLVDYDPDSRIQKICEYKYFFYDDLGATNFQKDSWTSQLIHQLLELRLNDRFATIITTNWDKEKIKERLEPRTVSRLFSKANTIIFHDNIDLREPAL